MDLAGLNTRAETVGDCSMERERRGGYQRRFYLEASEKYFMMAVEQPKENICVYADFLVEEDFCAMPDQYIINRFLGL